VEARFYQEIALSAPIFDLGCGDGQFAQTTFNTSIDVGLDPWTGPVKKAAKTGAYKLVLQGSGDDIPFPDQSFNSAISNSVLEHIPDLDPVLAEIHRILSPGALFVFCVPNHQFLENLSVSNFFDRIGLRGLGNWYRNFFNKISRHHHCDSPDVWRERMERLGFELVDWWHYFSPEAFHVLEWGHYFGLPSAVSHILFRKWILSPTQWNLSLTLWLVQKYYDEPAKNSQGSYTFFIARRK
jgi:SAM-dependent methyltransferase